MRHIRQTTSYSCGAASLAMILGISEYDAAQLAKTKKSGTNTLNVFQALKKQGSNPKFLSINLPFECIFTDLKLLSKQYPIYIGANFISNSGRGRNNHRHHAIVLKDETIFDPAQNEPVPMDCIGHLWNRQLVINSIILVNFPQ